MASPNAMAFPARVTGEGVGGCSACCFPSLWQPASLVDRGMWSQTLDLQNVSGAKLGCFLSSYKLHFYAVDLVPGNLKKVCDLVSDAKPKWYELGFQLEIKEVALEVIKMENSNNVQACFRKMLSAWLRTIDPPPSWEGLLTALEHDSVKCGDLAESIRQRFGILRQPQSKRMSEHSSSQAANPSGSREYIALGILHVFQF